jgi:hypothetical protein
MEPLAIVEPFDKGKDVPARFPARMNRSGDGPVHSLRC